jgi:hypothetical protein
VSLPTDFDDAADSLPRSTPFPFRPVEWPVRREFAVRTTVPPPAVDFAHVIETRRSIRAMARAPLRETVNLLAYGHMRRCSWGDNPRRSSGPSHSAGALHPIEVALITGRPRSRVFRIRPMDAALQWLRIVDAEALKKLNSKVDEVLPAARSDYIVLLADRQLTASHYSSARKLIWRDAGALMQTLHLCATAFRMTFCPAGIGGSELVEAIFGTDDRFEGVGVAVLGRSA